MTPNQINALIPKADSLERITNILGWINIALVVLTALVTIATFICSDRLSKAKDRIAELKIADANAAAAKANEGVSNANIKIEDSKNKHKQLEIEVAQAREKQAIAEDEQNKSKADLLKLQESLQPRKLTDRQKELLLKFLSSKPNNINKKFNIYDVRLEIYYAQGDAEAGQFANDISQNITKAGWQNSVSNRPLILDSKVPNVKKITVFAGIKEMKNRIKNGYNAQHGNGIITTLEYISNSIIESFRLIDLETELDIEDYYVEQNVIIYIPSRI